MTIRDLPRWLNRLLLALVASVWVYSGLEMATGFHQRSLLTRFDAVIVVLLGPIFVRKKLLQPS